MGYENLTPTLERIRMVTGFIAGRGERTETVFELEDSYCGSPQMAASVERMKADPDMARLMSEGYTPPEVDLKELLKHPPGSLGRTFAKFMTLQGFTPHFYPDRPMKDEADYCITRVRQTHDIHHVLTGFGAPDGGELGVIGVTAYQYGYPAFALIDLAAIALSFQQADGFQNALHLVGQGMRLGHDCKPLMGVKWEEGWEKPVARWRDELNIKPVTTGANSWYQSLPGMWS